MKKTVSKRQTAKLKKFVKTGLIKVVTKKKPAKKKAAKKTRGR